MSLILIGAHPHLIHYNKGELITKHFWGGSMELYIKKENVTNPIIHTIDLLPGGTYQNDIFDDVFVKEHQETYIQIYLIDCGGIWYVLQTLDIPDSYSKYYNTKEIRQMREELRKLSEDEINNFIKKLIEKLYSMLKTNGICVLSKFINDIFKENFIEILNSLGYLYEIENEPYLKTTIIIKKI
jgi:hypothetical protein